SPFRWAARAVAGRTWPWGEAPTWLRWTAPWPACGPGWPSGWVNESGLRARNRYERRHSAYGSGNRCPGFELPFAYPAHQESLGWIGERPGAGRADHRPAC